MTIHDSRTRSPWNVGSIFRLVADEEKSVKKAGMGEWDGNAKL